MSKTIRGKTSFQAYWLTDEEFSQWVQKDPNDIYKARCRVCPTANISVTTMGKQALTSHMKGLKHATAMSMISSPTLGAYLHLNREPLTNDHDQQKTRVLSNTSASTPSSSLDKKMEQQFMLKWNNYVNQITHAFGSLRSEEDLVDCTLSCEGRKIKAHKILLSACSTYFRDIFKDNPCQHPVIVFKNVKFTDLMAILDFMYKGEVSVLQDQIESFLSTAELLEVKGLLNSDESPNDGANLPTEEETINDDIPVQEETSSKPLSSPEVLPEKRRRGRPSRKKQAPIRFSPPPEKKRKSTTQETSVAPETIETFQDDSIVIKEEQEEYYEETELVFSDEEGENGTDEDPDFSPELNSTVDTKPNLLADEWQAARNQNVKPIGMEGDGVQNLFGIDKLPGRMEKNCSVCSAKSTAAGGPRRRTTYSCKKCKRAVHPLCFGEHRC